MDDSAKCNVFGLKKNSRNFGKGGMMLDKIWTNNCMSMEYGTIFGANFDATSNFEVNGGRTFWQNSIFGIHGFHSPRPKSRHGFRDSLFSNVVPKLTQFVFEAPKLQFFLPKSQFCIRLQGAPANYGVTDMFTLDATESRELVEEKSHRNY